MIRKLVVQNFRNLEPLELELMEGVTVVTGRNGQGKTNLLEALHVVSQGYSPRTRSLEGILRFQCKEAYLRMEGTGRNGQSLRQGFLWRDGDLQVKSNGDESKSLSLLHGPMHAVMMGPEDISLVKDGPEGRRRWIDVLLAARHTDGLDLLMRYRRILAQRNRWLKDHRHGLGSAPTSADLVVLDTLTGQLAALGAAVMIRRAQLLAELAPQVQAYAHRLSLGAEAVGLTYLGSVQTEGLDESMLQGKLERKMHAMRSVELTQGITAAGPHKDDIAIRFIPSGVQLREAGSQGQCRTVALSMGLVALDLGIGQDPEPPILLLDDIFAELDAHRRSALAEMIREKRCQVFVATPRAEDLPFPADQMLLVESGMIHDKI